MTIDELRALIAQGESEHLEFKRSTGNLSDGMKTVCAMLNGSRPAYVFFGVNDRGELVGQEVSTRTLEDIASQQLPAKAGSLSLEVRFHGTPPRP